MGITYNAYAITAVQTLLGICGSYSALLVIFNAWITDWCKPESKFMYFSILLGAFMGGMSLGPHVPKVLGVEGYSIFRLAAYMKVLSPVFVLLVFPSRVPCCEDDSEEALTRRFSARQLLAPPAEADAAPVNCCGMGLISWCQRARESLSYLCRHHLSATIIYVVMNFTETASQDCISMFLMKERGFVMADLNVL